MSLRITSPLFQGLTVGLARKKKEKKKPDIPHLSHFEKKVGICGWEEGNPYIGGPT
jgi:hypothetical protein